MDDVLRCPCCGSRLVNEVHVPRRDGCDRTFVCVTCGCDSKGRIGARHADARVDSPEGSE